MGYKIKKIYLGEDLVWPKPDPVTTPGAYWNEQLGLISLVFGISNGAPNPGVTITIADKNLGATTAWTPGDTKSQANCGNYYQWGNNYGFPYNGNPTTSSTLVNASTYGPSNYYNSSTFITVSGNTYADWSSDHNANLWGDTTGTYEALRGPCPTGFFIPGPEDWQTIALLGGGLGRRTYNDGEYTGSTFFEYLKLPCAGYYNCDATFVAPSSFSVGHYMTCSPETASSSTCFVNYSLYEQRGDTESNLGKVIAGNIRPFKNTVVVPDATWVKLGPNS